MSLRCRPPLMPTHYAPPFRFRYRFTLVDAAMPAIIIVCYMLPLLLCFTFMLPSLMLPCRHLLYAARVSAIGAISPLSAMFTLFFMLLMHAVYAADAVA